MGDRACVVLVGSPVSHFYDTVVKEEAITARGFSSRPLPAIPGFLKLRGKAYVVSVLVVVPVVPTQQTESSVLCVSIVVLTAHQPVSSLCSISSTN